ncbi:MAG TPA: hypothetical protein VL119_07780 [Acidimicrobiia bacterium]|nr:hypothetical protein [Acidimicrobiia bacterium]
MDEPSLWCPSCGAEYQVGVERCTDCRVALVLEKPTHLVDIDDDQDAEDDGLVEIGEWPKIQAQVLRRRLETASVPVMIEWTGSADDRRGVVLVPEDQAEFASAVVNEIDVEDEVSDDSPHAYVSRIEELLSAAAGLLDELRTRLDDLEADGRL